MSRRTRYLAQGAQERKFAGAFRLVYDKYLADRADSLLAGEEAAAEEAAAEEAAAEEANAVQAARVLAAGAPAKERSVAPEKATSPEPRTRKTSPTKDRSPRVSLLSWALPVRGTGSG